MLEHDLHAHKQRATRTNGVQHARGTAQHAIDQALQPVQAHGKPDQVRRHHHHDIEHGTNTTDDAVGRGLVLPFRARERDRGEDFGQDEEDDQPAPQQQLQVDVVPQGDEREDGKHVEDAAELARAAARTAAQGDVDVAHDPSVVAAVPGAPERQRRVIVAHAAHDVLGGIDAVDERPEPEEAPGDEQLEPDDVQVEVAEHAQFEGRVGRPVRV